MNLPRKHHYSPQFYLGGWSTPPDGRLCCIRKVHGGGIVRSWKAPAATGYGRDMYRTDGLPAGDSQRVETAFMSPIDNDAASVLQRLIDGDRTPLDAKERSAWARFVISLLFRHPIAVALLKAHTAEMWEEATKRLEEEYPGVKLTVSPAAPAIDASNMLTDLIDNDRLGPTIFDMHWCVVDLSKSDVALMTSDRPIYMPLGLANQEAHIALPLSPTRLFVAAYNDRFARGLPTVKHSAVVKHINKTVVMQAREFVWAVDDSQFEFVKKYMSAAPERVLLTEEQRKEALDAARGITRTKDTA